MVESTGVNCNSVLRIISLVIIGSLEQLMCVLFGNVKHCNRSDILKTLKYLLVLKDRKTKGLSAHYKENLVIKR